MNKKQEIVKDFNPSKCKLILFILDLAAPELLRGMYSKLKKYFWSRNSYVPELVLNYISELILNYIPFNAKSKSHMNVWDAINITKWKIKRSDLIFQGLFYLEDFLDQV